MAHLPKPYDRARVIDRLARHGVYAVNIPSPTGFGPILSHLEAHEDELIGLKLWAYIDSLDVPLQRTWTARRKGRS